MIYQPISNPNPNVFQKILVKVLLLGSEKTGKSSIINRFVANKFSESYKPTIGADFRTKVININGKNITTQLWDTVGSEKFKSLTLVYKGADIALFVCDASDLSSLDKIPSYV